MCEKAGLQGQRSGFDVFVSYEECEPDRRFAEWLVRRLKKHELRVATLKADLIAGEQRVEGQARLIQASRRTVAVISQAYLASGFCRSHVLSSLYLGMEDRASRVIPVALEAEIPTDLPPWLEELALILWHEEDALAQPWDRLMQALIQPDQPRPPAPVRSWRRYESALAPHGSADLKLKPIRSPGAARSEFDLLRASYRATTLVGREGDLKSLNGWLLENDRLSVRVIAGPAGVGKTRLAHELIRGVPEGWQAGLIEPRDLVDLDKSERRRPWRWDSPTLAVIDCASEAGTALTEWIVALAEEPEPDSPPLRVLLLDSGASDEVGWFSELRRLWLTSAGSEIGPIPLPNTLAPMHQPDLQIAVFRQARSSARSWHGIQEPDLLSEESAGALIRDARWSEPLALMMAGVLSLWLDPAGLVVRNPRRLAADLADRERARIQLHPKLGESSRSKRFATFAAAHITLAGGLPRVDVEDMLEEIAVSVGPRYADVTEAAQDALLDRMARLEGGVGPLRPDLPAEAFVLDELFGDNGFRETAAAAALEFAWSRNRSTAISFWIRMIHDFSDPAHPEDRHSRRASEALDLLCRRAEREPEPDRLELSRALLGSTPEHSVSMSDAALQWARWQAEALQRQTTTDGSNHLWDFPASLDNLSLRLSEVGKREEALEYAEEATRIRRQLATWLPEVFLPALATTLNNLGKMLSELGRREEALAAAVEAAATYRQLADTRPDAFLPDLAMSLNNLGNMLSALGRREEALAAALKAVATYRQLADSRPDAFLPDLAMSLNNLGTMLSALGRREEALAAALKAVVTYRQLAESRPDAFLPDLAMSLNNLGNMLSELGRREEALATAEQAVSIRRQLADTRPDAFLPDLASSLNNLANRLSELSRREEALAAAEQAAATYRQLAETRPDAFLPNLAMSLNNLGHMMSELGRRESALAGALEAEGIYRRMADSHPDAFLPDLAMSLNNLGNRLSELGRWEDALAAADEAVEIRRRLAKDRPDAFLPDLAKSCGVRGQVLRSAGREQDAIASFAEGLRAIAQPLAALPVAPIQLALILAREYLHSCGAAGCEPDLKLLQPVMTAVQLVEHGREGDDEDV